MSGARDSDETVTSPYNFRYKHVCASERFREDTAVAAVMVGAFCSFLLGLLNPGVVNKAGPDWLWAGGRSDFVRNLYFRPNGAFRRFGFLALMLTFAAGTAALVWLLPRL